jgi:chemotaxis protein CheD
MNHFLMPVTRDPSQATARYGNVATAALINYMVEAGSHKGDLLAQIVGGGRPDHLPSVRDIGSENADIALKVLKRKRVRVVSSDIGGSMGRKVVFDTATGNVAVLKVHQLRESDWFVDEASWNGGSRRA